MLVREHGALEKSFAVVPDYLLDAESHGAEVNFSDRGLQLTRTARAVKVWSSLSAFGVGAFREGIDRNLDLVEIAQHFIEEDPDLELVNPANLGIVCFRRQIAGLSEAQGAAVNSWLIAALEATSRAMVSSTRLHGRFALRMCVLNHLTQESDVRWTLEFLARTPIPAMVLREADSSVVADDVALVSLLSPQGRRELMDRSFRREFAAGSTIVSRWATDRDFYVVLEGQVSVRLDESVLGRLGPGDFIGEIAASDWGSGYGYVRTADIYADGDTAVLLVPAEALLNVMAYEPAFRARVRAARADRLTRM